MEWLGWIIAVAVVTFVGGQIVHTYRHPFEPKKCSHTHREKYEPVRTTDNILSAFLLTGTRITPPSGNITLEGQTPLTG